MGTLDRNLARAYDDAYAAVMHGMHAEPGAPQTATGLTQDEVVDYAAAFFKMAGVNYLASWRKPGTEPMFCDGCETPIAGPSVHGCTLCHQCCDCPPEVTDAR